MNIFFNLLIRISIRTSKNIAYNVRMTQMKNVFLAACVGSMDLGISEYGTGKTKYILFISYVC